MRLWALLLLLLFFSYGCVQHVPCSYFLEKEHMSVSSYTGCVVKEALSLAAEGEVGEAVKKCEQLKGIGQASLMGVKIGSSGAYNYCITEVAKFSKDEEVCSHIDTGLVDEFLKIGEGMAKLIPIPGSGTVTPGQGTQLLSKTEEVCREEVRRIIREDQAMRRLWENIMEGFEKTFSPSSPPSAN